MAAGMDIMDSLGKVGKQTDEPSAAAGDDAVMDVVSAERSAAADGGAAAEARAEEVQARCQAHDFVSSAWQHSRGMRSLMAGLIVQLRMLHRRRLR